MRKISHGFTLIELLIVVAIIGILAAVILGNLGAARKSAQITQVKSNLVNMRDSIQQYNINNGNFGTAGDTCSPTPTGMFADNLSGVSKFSTPSAYPGGTTLTCNTSGTSWAVSASLVDGTFWCLDSAGQSKSEGTDIGAATVCP